MRPKQKKARIEDSGMHVITDVDDDDSNNNDDDDDGWRCSLRRTTTHIHPRSALQTRPVRIDQTRQQSKWRWSSRSLWDSRGRTCLKLHGNVFIERCEKCGTRYKRPFYVLDDHASLYYEELNDLGSTSLKKPRHAKECDLCGLCHRTGRKCNRKGCKGQLIDSIINFCDNLEEEILALPRSMPQDVI
ncbi:hypothetical protein OS493_022160 [Desmophyllum pertusum]|uniref:Uncharacterized protein n=1 Tax=Desmophyllum pertusum TaxID=174260 RepID=A0A9W9YMH2_9CNID|nr:hypothetical protein OS493_022160 [Desmophyllum pertusum]